MSGSNKYTEEEVSARVDALRTSASVVDRNTIQSADDLVSGIQDLIFRTLNSDVDSVYALLKLFANRHISISSKILAHLDTLERFAPVTRQETPTPDTGKLSRLIEISTELETASAGDREILLAEFTRTTEDFSKSSVSSDGFHNAGVSPASAREQSMTLAEEADFLIGVLIEEIDYFLDSLATYASAKLEPLSFEAQARKATSVLLEHENKEDLSGALLDSTILSSLLGQQSATKLDITSPKYDGVVETQPGVAAEMFGGTKPFILQADSIVEFALGSGDSADIAAPQSEAPSVSATVSRRTFLREEAGNLYCQATPQAAADEKWFSSSGTDTDGGTTDDEGNAILVTHYLKAAVRPSSGTPSYLGKVQVSALVHDDSGTDIPVVAFDDGVTGLLFNEDSSSEILTHILVPDSAYNGVDVNFTFTSPYPNRMKPPIYEGNLTWSLAYIESAVFQYAFTPTLIAGATPGFYECSGGLVGDYCEINFSTGVINLTFGIPPTVNAQVVPTNYQVTFGRVDYETGHIFVQMPYPLTEGSYLTCSYGYYPLGRMNIIDTTPGVYPPPVSSFFNVLKVLNHNTLISSTLPPPTTDPATWLKGPSDLGDLISASSLASETTFSSVSTGTTTIYTFASGLYGSASRISFPNHRALSADSTPFAPTWFETPTSVNEAINALYVSSGESFGSDTPYLSMVATGPINISCPPKSIASVAITAIAATSLPDTTTLTVPVSAGALEVGDDLRVSWAAGSSGLSRTASVFHTKITSVTELSETESDLEVWPTLPLAIDDTTLEALTLGGEWSCAISRSRVRVQSQNNASNSAITVSNILGEDLGFVLGAVTTGLSDVVALSETNLSGVATENGYEIHPNDVVLEQAPGGALLHIGRVTSISGNIVSIEVSEGVEYTYPFENLRVVPLGWYKFTGTRDALYAALTKLRSITSDNPLLAATNIFVNSGSGQGQYMSLLFELKAALDLVRESYLGYDAHVVKTVDKLLDTLKQERLTLPLDMLMTGRFDKLSDLTVAEVSGQTSIDNLLVRAFNILGGETSFVEYSTVSDPLTDYDNRGVDNNFSDLDLTAPED